MRAEQPSLSTTGSCDLLPIVGFDRIVAGASFGRDRDAAQSSKPMISARRPPGASKLPRPRSPLIGRIQEADEVRRLLLHPEVPIVTLTGPGGIGKTRLAVQVADDLRDHFSNGVYFVPLAPIRNPDLVDAAICEALDLTSSSDGLPLNRLHAHLRDKEILLLLDNFEHVVEAAPLVAELLTSCPSLKVLATSRMPRGLPANTTFQCHRWRFQIPDIYLPWQTWRTSRGSRFSFSERMPSTRPSNSRRRMRSMSPRFAFALDGLPLAIELAAARTRMLARSGPARPSHQSSSLSDGRPARTNHPGCDRCAMRLPGAMILLGPAEQARLLRHLSVFAGGFSLEAAEAVAGSPHLKPPPLTEGCGNLSPRCEPD